MMRQPAGSPASGRGFAGRLLARLRRHRTAAAVLALALPLAAGAFGFGPLLAGRLLKASEQVRRERVLEIAAAVAEVRDEARREVARVVGSGRGIEAAAVRVALARTGWETVPGIFTPDDGIPGDATPELSRVFLDAVDREGIVAAYRFDTAGPQLIIGVRTDAAGAGPPGAGTAPLVVAVRPARAPLARALGRAGDLGAALYVEGRSLVVSPAPLSALLPSDLDEELIVAVIGEEQPRPFATGGGDEFLGAVAPLKDFESWDVIGLVAAGAPRSAWQGLERRGDGFALLLLALALLAALALVPAVRSTSGRAPWLALPALIPVVAGGLLMRSRLQAGVEDVLGSGPAAVRQALAAGGLVERYTFGAELLLLGAFVLMVFWAALVLLTAANLDRPRTLRTTFTAWAFLSPSVLGLLVFFLGPMLFALFISFHSWSIVESAKPFVGLDNYTELVANADFRHSLAITFLYTLHVPVSMALALGLALLLNRPRRGVGLFRTLFFLPSITSFVAIAMVWEWIYNPDFGLANVALGLFGLDGSGWLTNPATALVSLMLMAIWISMGYQMVIFLAGLQGIPHTLHEAAVIDGAGPVRRFFRITLPLLKPTIFFVLVTSLIGSFQVFTQVYIMTDGGPVRATDVVVYHIYSAAWDQFRMGSAAAMSWVLFVIVMLLTLLQFRLAGREVSYV